MRETQQRNCSHTRPSRFPKSMVNDVGGAEIPSLFLFGLIRWVCLSWSARGVGRDWGAAREEPSWIQEQRTRSFPQRTASLSSSSSSHSVSFFFRLLLIYQLLTWASAVLLYIEDHPLLIRSVQFRSSQISESHLLCVWEEAGSSAESTFDAIANVLTFQRLTRFDRFAKQNSPEFCRKESLTALGRRGKTGVFVDQQISLHSN